ncbi:g3417 [Coccomyxa elongata]
MPHAKVRQDVQQRLGKVKCQVDGTARFGGHLTPQHDSETATSNPSQSVKIDSNVACADYACVGERGARPADGCQAPRGEAAQLPVENMRLRWAAATLRADCMPYASCKGACSS